jgi:hypothetical protein
LERDVAVPVGQDVSAFLLGDGGDVAGRFGDGDVFGDEGVCRCHFGCEDDVIFEEWRRSLGTDVFGVYVSSLMTMLMLENTLRKIVVRCLESR